MSKLATTFYKIRASCTSVRGVRLAVIADLHSTRGRTADSAIEILKAQKPDYILAAGDIFERLDGRSISGMEAGLELLRASAAIAPTFYSIGNHENGGTASWNKLKWFVIRYITPHYDSLVLEKIKATGAHLLDDEYTSLNGIYFGGLSSGMINEKHAPHTEWLDGFCAEKGAKILLCHHPEYYKKYLRARDIDLIVSGHAHGGQWRFFGRGVFAPGQGLFPRYTSGVHDGRLVISRGLKPSGTIPRIFNKPEVVIIDLI